MVVDSLVVCEELGQWENPLLRHRGKSLCVTTTLHGSLSHSLSRLTHASGIMVRHARSEDSSDAVAVVVIAEVQRYLFRLQHSGVCNMCTMALPKLLMYFHGEYDINGG